MSLPETVDEIDHLSDDERDCIETCNEAARVCEWCATESLGSDGMERCVRLCRDVADIASLHARLLARDAEYGDDLATVCADVCEACAEECRRHDSDHCNRCAEVLSECAERCRTVA